MTKILVINGPNLNKLGERDNALYGAATLSEINAELQSRADALGVRLVFKQSNHEGEIIDFIQSESADSDGIIINAGGFTHTSVALADALADCKIRYVEVHLSNIYGRESFRRKSLLAESAVGTVCGLGPRGYHYALNFLANKND